MQSIDSPAAPSPERAEDLAEDLYTLVHFVLKATQPDIFRALEHLQFSLSQLKLMMILDGQDQEQCSLGRIGESLGLSLPACSRAVDALHQRGLVERRVDEADRRVKRVCITDAGRAVVRTVDEARLTAITQFTQSLSSDEQRQLAAALAPIVARADVAACRPERTSSS